MVSRECSYRCCWEPRLHQATQQLVSLFAFWLEPFVERIHVDAVAGN